MIAGCSRKEQSVEKPGHAAAALGDSAAVAPAPRSDTASDDATKGYHARPLEQIPPLVPAPIRTPWLQNHFAWYVPPQGKAPEHWSDLEKDIRPEACGACHQQQFADWKNSLHHKAMSPTVLGQLLDMELDAPVLSITCQRCHAPLAEQIPYLEKGVKNPAFQEGLREQGLVCAACHVRGHERFGPPPRKPKSANAPHGGFTVKEEYESPAFCASCHDFTPGGGMHGKLVQETAEEWRRTPFAVEGKTCQSCHMPDRRHLWKGIHDSAMTASAVSIQAQFSPPDRPGDSLRALITLTNVGAGHRFPTYTEPQIKLIVEQLDKKGKAIEGSYAEGIIARRVTEEMDKELFDTRLLPGETYSLAYSMPRKPGAVSLATRVEVWPDEAYRLYFRKMLDTPALKPEMPAVLKHMEAALKQDTDSRYLLWKKTFRL